jgi:choline kinase
MKSIILAAGLGSRLGTLTKDIPKATIEVASQPLIQRAVNFARKIGIDEIIVVGGYKFQRVREIVAGEGITILENREYKKGNFYSLSVAQEYLDDDFVLMNIDHLYPSHLARMINEVSDGIWAVSDFDRPLFADDMKIVVKGDLYIDGQLSAISKGLGEFDGGYCGITVVKGDALDDYKLAFKNVMKHGRDQAVVEDIQAELIRLGKAPRVLDISGIRWLEIDTQEDLANAERIIRMKPHFLD